MNLNEEKQFIDKLLSEGSDIDNGKAFHDIIIDVEDAMRSRHSDLHRTEKLLRNAVDKAQKVITNITASLSKQEKPVETTEQSPELRLKQVDGNRFVRV